MCGSLLCSVSVLIVSVKSDCHCLGCGVPQGSAARPLLFILFSALLQDLIAAQLLFMQMILSFTHNPADLDLALAKINACIAA